MVAEFDIHVAGQGINELLHNALVNIGFQDDGLVGRHVSVVDGVPVSSCPLIGIHMSKKADSRTQSLDDLNETKRLMEEYQMRGYGHSEVTLTREVISSDNPLYPHVKPAFFPLEPSPSKVNKIWDIHIAIPQDRLDNRLKEVMLGYGFDWINLSKPNKSPYRVYSVQGTCSLDSGRRLYTSVVDWLRNMHVPFARCKLERYVEMYRTGESEIVPPVVNNVRFT